MSAITAWIASRAYRADKKDESQTRAYMLRNHHINLLLTVITVCKGRDYTMCISKDVYDFMLLHSDFNEYKEV